MEKLAAVLQEEGFSMDPVFEKGKDYLLFDATARVLILRFVSALSLICPAFLSILVLRMTKESMINDLGSIAAGRILQAGLILLSCVYFFLMLWFSGKYVLKIIRTGDGSLQLAVWRMLLPDKIYVLDKTDFSEPVSLRGRTFMVQGSYYSTRVHNKRLIIDRQGKFPMGEDTVLEAMGTDL